MTSEATTEFGRIIKVATSIESVPHSENHPLIHAPSPDGLDDQNVTTSTRVLFLMTIGTLDVVLHSIL